MMVAVQILSMGVNLGANMEFQDSIILNEKLIDGLKDRSYSLIGFSDEQMAVFSNEAKEFPIEIFISRWDGARSIGSLNICSRSVTEQFFEYQLFFDQTPHEPIGVLGVDLLWLRWNEDPANAESRKYDYALSTEDGLKRFFYDLDTVGKSFLDSVSAPLDLALMLENLEKYPVRIKWGGKPRSADPLLYSAMLFLQCDERVHAKEVYEMGIQKYGCAPSDAEWKVRRIQDFLRRGELLKLI
jgi:hypothetical protein